MLIYYYPYIGILFSFKINLGTMMHALDEYFISQDHKINLNLYYHQNPVRSAGLP